MAGNSNSPGHEDATAQTMSLLKELRLIEIQTSRLVDQHLAGSYHSVFKGQGVSFAEVRPYEPGDDVRAIHWPVTARTGAPHIKLFTEERELTLMLVVDMSASLAMGSREVDKRHLVARLAATFAFSAIRNHDRVGLIGYTDQVEVVVPPRAGRKHVLSVIQSVLTHVPRSKQTNHATGLEYLAKLGLHGAVVISISDFIGAAEATEVRAPGPAKATRFERALKLVRRRNDLIPVRVEDPLELALPALGLLTLDGFEDDAGEPDFIDFSPKKAEQYAAEVKREREAFASLLNKLRLEVLSVQCGEAWEKPLVHFFRRRARRLRG